jgi:hypothetical protein
VKLTKTAPRQLTDGLVAVPAVAELRLHRLSFQFACQQSLLGLAVTELRILRATGPPSTLVELNARSS